MVWDRKSALVVAALHSVSLAVLVIGASSSGVVQNLGTELPAMLLLQVMATSIAIGIAYGAHRFGSDGARWLALGAAFVIGQHFLFLGALDTVGAIVTGTEPQHVPVALAFLGHVVAVPFLYRVGRGVSRRAVQ